jgi:hypothetical protein
MPLARLRQTYVKEESSPAARATCVVVAIDWVLSSPDSLNIASVRLAGTQRHSCGYATANKRLTTTSLRGSKRLFQEGVSASEPVPQAIRIGCHIDDRDLRIPFLRGFRYSVAIQATRHLDVGDDQVDIVRVDQQTRGLIAVGSFQNVEARIL